MAEGRAGIFAGKTVTADIDNAAEVVGKLSSLRIGNARVERQRCLLCIQRHLNLVIDGEATRAVVEQIEIRSLTCQHLRRRQPAARILGGGAGHLHGVVDQLFD